MYFYVCFAYYRDSQRLIKISLFSGYVRVLLVLAAWAGFNNPEIFVPCYGISVVLDGVDGFVARRLQQTSELGAWLDVVIDNTGRGMLWSMLFQWGWLVPSLEWNVFVCNHRVRGAEWKCSFSDSPRWVQAVMANSFKSPLGVLAISGLHILPVWLYGLQMGILTQILHLPAWLQTLGTLLLSMGRLLCLSVEVGGYMEWSTTVGYGDKLVVQQIIKFSGSIIQR
ncbi:uncharacterized protein si:ch1073-145m9.1 isoform X1 [Brienomyrus brachyistius]|uniref:uncharacterized protein si:ch1073-145m9.1 isoform X1 n=1 Tax=Brienomyrus brachyistius TaxID=42636 RepID=UPI0020B21FAC|nr:uncharacterized protein si:ch1073-145m9.1 isoform X1 [Brienomyrus brachyistius]